MEFITSGISSPLGRPVSLASFTLDAKTWPTDPRPFRVTNLIIHLVNGLLVFLLTRVIFSVGQTRKTADLLALIAVVIWILHPLLVSTTAYIIQRMTLLSALFTLSGLLCYAYGRKRLAVAPLAGWVLIGAGMGVFGLLAVLSKESGVLLPFYALAIEFTVFRQIDIGRRHKHALLTILWLPLAAIAAYVLLGWDETLTAFEFRPFELHERILTQFAVLLDYLWRIVVPSLSGLGVIHDDFPVSRGLLDPVATLVNIVIVLGLIGVALFVRKKMPVVSLGILWFFVGHSLEAGPFSLELYFEHRNYLPLLGPVIAVCSLLPLAKPSVRRLLALPLAVFVLLEIFVTWQAATTWSSEDRLMQTAVAEHPNSMRAQQFVVNSYILHGQYEPALRAQQLLLQKYPRQASISMSILNLRCILGVLTAEQVEETLGYLEHSEYDRLVVGYLGPLISNAETGACGEFGFRELDAVFDALLRAPKLASNEVRGAVHYHKGITYYKSARLDEALAQLDLSYEENPDIDVLINQIVWLLNADRADDAERYLRLARAHETGRFWQRNYREADLNTLQQLVDQIRTSPR